MYQHTIKVSISLLLIDQGCIVPSFVKIDPGVLKKNSVVPLLNKLESHSPKHALCQVWLKLAHGSWRRRKCDNWSCIVPEKSFEGRQDVSKNGMTLHLNNLNFFHPRICTKSGWLKSVGPQIFFCNFAITFPFEKAMTLYMNKLPLFSQVWLKSHLWLCMHGEAKSFRSALVP